MLGDAAGTPSSPDATRGGSAQDGSAPASRGAPASAPQSGAWVFVFRALLVLSMFVLPPAYLIYSALVRPEIEFLAASDHAQWAFYPNQQVKMRGRPVSLDVTFRRVFDLEEVPKRFDLRVFAFTEMTVTINRKVVVPAEPRPNWKHAAIIELAPHLRKGPNRLLIRVHNPEALPGLLVESPAELATLDEWQATLERPRRKGFVPVVAPMTRDPNPGLIQRSAAWSWARWPAWSWLVLVGCIGVWVLVGEITGRHRGREPAPRPLLPAWLHWAVPTAILLGGYGLNLFNASVYPHDYGHFDWWGHLEYIQIVASEWRSPLASEGWQTYQPPLYYFFAAIVYSLAGGGENLAGAIKAAQYLSTTVGFGLAILTWLTVRKVMRDNAPAQWVAFAFAAFLPMNVYMNPQVTNEVFAATAIAAGIYCAILLIERPVISLRFAAWTGCVAGAGLLGKFGGLFPIGAVGMALVLRAIYSRQRQDWGGVLAFGLGAFAVCGWFFIRNVVTYGHPFAANWGYDTGWHVEQLPAFRTFEFYARFGSVFLDHPTEGVWSSFLDGKYATLWADAWFAFFKINDVDNPAFGWMGVTIFVAALPTMAMVMGMAQTLVSALRRPAMNRDVIMITASLWTLGALLLYTMEVPTHSVIKAFYFMFLVPTLGLALARGREMLRRQLPWSRVLLDITVVLLVAMAVWVYRFSG